MFEPGQEAVRGHLRVIEQLLGELQRRTRNPGRGELPLPVRGRVLRGARLYGASHLLGVGAPILRQPAGLARPAVFEANNLHHLQAKRARHGGNGDHPVPGWQVAVIRPDERVRLQLLAPGDDVRPGFPMRERRLQVLDELGSPLVEDIDVVHVVVLEEERSLEEGDVEALALAGPFARVEGGRNAPRQQHPGHVVDDRVGERRWAVGVEVQQPGIGGEDDIHAGGVGHRSFPPVGGVLGVDEPRVAGGQRLVVETMAGRLAGPEVRHHNVGSGRKLHHGSEDFGVAQVHSKGTLATVLVQELAAFARDDLPVTARLIAFEGFDLDNVGAAVREELAAIRRGNEPPEFDHAQPSERTRHRLARLPGAFQLSHPLRRPAE